MPGPTDDEAREQVLAAASQLFYTRGVQAVGMDALRTAAGVSLKRLYQLFGSKDAIVEQVLHRQREAWNRLVEQTVATPATARDKLLAIYDMLARWSAEDDFRGCMFINTFGELGGVDPRIAGIIRAQKAEFQDRVAALVAEAGGPASLAAQLAILAEGAQTTTAIAGSNAAAGQARAAARTLIDAALAGQPVDPASAGEASAGAGLTGTAGPPDGVPTRMTAT